jgi:hypothetical protein
VRAVRDEDFRCEPSAQAETYTSPAVSFSLQSEYAQNTIETATGHCQSKFVYFAKTSEPDFAAIDFPAFFRVDLSGLMAAPSI